MNNRKAKAHSVVVAGITQTLKRLEQFLLFLRRDTRSFIADNQFHLFGDSLSTHPHLASRRITQGVIKEIGQDTLHEGCIRAARNSTHTRVQMDAPNLLRGMPKGAGSDGTMSHLCHLDDVVASGDCSSGKPGVIQQIGDQPGEFLDARRSFCQKHILVLGSEFNVGITQ